MVKVQDMIGNMGCAEDQVAHNPAIVRNLIGDPEGTIQIQGGGCGVAGRAYSANALGVALCITRISAAQDDFYASKEHTGALGILDLPILYHCFNLEVTFNPSYRINNNLTHWLDLHFHFPWPTFGRASSVSFT